MVKILFVSDNDKKIKEFQDILTKNNFEFLHSDDEIFILDTVQVESPDMIIFDNEIESLDLQKLCKKVKSFAENTVIILLVQNNVDNISHDLMKNANAFLTEPLSQRLVLSTIASNLRMKNSLEELSNSNQELARSLYQLNVLYNTSSQFAGTLDKDKLIDIMLEGMDKSLGYSLSCTLTFRSENEPVLILNSLYKISDRLLEALKLRTILNYKSLFEKKEMPFELKMENLKIEKHIKHEIKEYDFSVLRFDSMFAPITLSKNFFGFIEIYRETEFSTEDATCFQTVAQQVSLPLKSASLYQEIKDTNKKLEKLERLKSEFISIVSHELRTPLTAIKNSLDIILSKKAGDITENMEKFLSMAKRNVTRLSGIINDLLDLSKIEAGKMDFKYSITRIEPVIEYVKTNLYEVAKEKELELRLNLKDHLAYIYADAHRLEQVLTNLISNAIKFTNPNGKIEISTDIVNAKDLKVPPCFEEDVSTLSGNYVMVCVADEGIGIEEKDLTRVFDKFAQIENSLSRNVGGTGLGLPIARQLMEAHNGTIWCESEINKGSKFYFVIPVAGDKNNFLLTKKQLINRAKTSNTTLATITLNCEGKIMEEILNCENLISKTYLNNSLLEKEENRQTLTMLVLDGDKFSAEFLNKKLTEYIKKEYPNDTKCDIMYSYQIFPEETT